ncbi:MAG: secondary thiamine-phosphate synthase enzyme YjbQ [Bryobacteraceae bacterium]|nr:secondary thiamine-phosphate synthase enzyme YjbQ [Bryobacteraceae bacterium]
MSTAKLQPVESQEHGLEPPELSGPPAYRVANRILDWITSERTQLLNITERINEVVRKSGIRNGLVHLQSLHTTTAVFLNEWQEALLDDVKAFLEETVSPRKYYRHNDPQLSDCERQNADSHLRGMLMGQSLLLQVRNAKVLLGTWQTIVLAEFDGPRSRSLAVQVSGV